MSDKTVFQKHKVFKFLVLISTKFINQNLPKTNDEIFKKNLVLPISASNIERCFTRLAARRKSK